MIARHGVLALDEIEPDATFYGVPVAETENGDLIALTHDRRRATAALNRYSRERLLDNLLGCLALCRAGCEEPRHRVYGCRTLELSPQWAVFRAPNPAIGEDPLENRWFFELADDGAPGAIPMVVIWV
jgi:hypothetical protein